MWLHVFLLLINFRTIVRHHLRMDYFIKTDEVVAEVASVDAKARRIDDSFMSFREQLTGLGRRPLGHAHGALA